MYRLGSGAVGPIGTGISVMTAGVIAGTTVGAAEAETLRTTGAGTLGTTGVRAAAGGEAPTPAGSSCSSLSDTDMMCSNSKSESQRCE